MYTVDAYKPLCRFLVRLLGLRLVVGHISVFSKKCAFQLLGTYVFLQIFYFSFWLLWFFRVFRFARMEGASSAEIECALAADVCAVFDAVVSLEKCPEGFDAFQLFDSTDAAAMSNLEAVGFC